MPHIPARVANSVFYLFKNADDAKQGKDPRATGFLVVHGEENNDPSHFYYAVTNWHAIRGSPVIRLNRIDGGIDVIELDDVQWEFLPNKYDVAVVPINLEEKIHEVAAIGTWMFLQEPTGKHLYHDDRVGVGEDVFMLGLFIDHGDMPANIPSARFGNISMLPDSRAPILQPTGYAGVSFVVDMHSRTGFSGSPVFAYRTFGSDLSSFGRQEIDGFDLDFDGMSIDERMGGGCGAVELRGPGARLGRASCSNYLVFYGVFFAKIGN